MKRVVLILVALAGLVFSGAASATTFVTPKGAPAGGSWAAWAAQSAEPTVPGRVQIWPASLCGGAGGCSNYYTDVNPHVAILHAEGRFTFYFEMGHLFDWELLTWAERGTLSKIWGVYGHPWNDTWAAVQAGREDGLEADFAAVYAYCAEGITTGGLQSGDAPSILMRSSCSYIRSVA